MEISGFKSADSHRNQRIFHRNWQISFEICGFPLKSVDFMDFCIHEVLALHQVRPFIFQMKDQLKLPHLSVVHGKKFHSYQFRFSKIFLWQTWLLCLISLISLNTGT